MNEYIARVKRLSTTDSLNSEVINSVVQQLQHNIDVLYNSINLNNRNWNVSELVFGNMLDINSTGEKVFVNGGRMDSLEKVLSFTPSIGSTVYENNTDLVYEDDNDIEDEHFLRWDVASDITENIILTRNIAVPEQLRHQNIILGFKMAGFTYNQIITEESYEIYVNGAFVGSGTTGVDTTDGLYRIKTIYGSYSLSGNERNLEVKLVRSTTQTATPTAYRVRVQDAFIGLNSLALDQYILNYPPVANLATDLSSFYDFENNSVVPVPKVWTNFNATEATSTLNVTLNQQPATFQDTYWVAKDATGNGLGTTVDNMMSSETFFNIEAFPSNSITVHLNCSDTYGEFTFNKGGSFLVNVTTGDINCQQVTVDNGTNVHLNVTVPDGEDRIRFICDGLSVSDNSRFSTDTEETMERYSFTCDGNMNVDGQSSVELNVGMYITPLDKDYQVTVNDHSHFKVVLKQTNFVDTDSPVGMGCVIAPIASNKYSFVELTSNNDLLSAHIANSSAQDKPVIIKNHSQLIIGGFIKINTFTNDKTFYAFLHSSIEISCPIEWEVGANCETAYTNIELALFSTFGSVVEMDGGNVVYDWVENIPQELVESFVYVID